MIMERNRNFTEGKFPIDVLWMDIEWAQQYSEWDGYEYFFFNPQNFTDSEIEQMNAEVEASDRHLTVIVDPHIKASHEYPVFADGLNYEKNSTSDNLVNVFVKSADLATTYLGDCWPSTSAYIDFLNENAQSYWGSWFNYDKFRGSNSRYHFWNDMNEPSVFDTDSKTMPLEQMHCKADGSCYQHRDVHNAYGALHSRSSFRGLLERDNNTLRPFVLTRSWHMGSQKFGAYWTGDNNAENSEVQGSMIMIIQNSIAGVHFGGADIPGFAGEPTDDLYVQFYQMGIYYPFMRAHSTLENQNREPWL
jgi:mannosyl-oligosaccharide alpha-1,3-glucosidase